MGWSNLPTKALGRQAARWSVTTDRPMLTWEGKLTKKWKESSIYKIHRRKRWTNPRYVFHYYKTRRQLKREINEYGRTHQGIMELD